MDGIAVNQSEEEQLKSLGLFQMGHIVAVKSFCRKTEVGDLKTKLVDSIKNSAKDRTVSKEKKSSQLKTIFLGWQHYDRKKRKYVNVRESRGGGVRTCKFHLRTSPEELMDKMESLFFKNGKNSFAGRLSILRSDIGNSNGDVLGSRKDGFDLEKYILINGFTRLRLYLLTKEKSLNDWGYFHDDSNSDDDFDINPKEKLNGNLLDEDFFRI